MIQKGPRRLTWSATSFYEDHEAREVQSLAQGYINDKARNSNVLTVATQSTLLPLAAVDLGFILHTGKVPFMGKPMLHHTASLSPKEHIY